MIEFKIFDADKILKTDIYAGLLYSLLFNPEYITNIVPRVGEKIKFDDIDGKATIYEVKQLTHDFFRNELSQYIEILVRKRDRHCTGSATRDYKRDYFV